VIALLIILLGLVLMAFVGMNAAVAIILLIGVVLVIADILIAS